MKRVKGKTQNRIARHRRIRARLSGTAKRPRFSVYKSNTAIYAQIINDDKGETLVSASTNEIKGKKGADEAKELGKMIAERALAKKIKEVAFDRGGFIYTGKIKALADSAREAGLTF